MKHKHSRPDITISDLLGAGWKETHNTSPSPALSSLTIENCGSNRCPVTMYLYYRRQDTKNGITVEPRYLEIVLPDLPAILNSNYFSSNMHFHSFTICRSPRCLEMFSLPMPSARDIELQLQLYLMIIYQNPSKKKAISKGLKLMVFAPIGHHFKRLYSLRRWRDFARECLCFGGEAGGIGEESIWIYFTRGFATRKGGRKKCQMPNIACSRISLAAQANVCEVAKRFSNVWHYRGGKKMSNEIHF